MGEWMKSLLTFILILGVSVSAFAQSLSDLAAEAEAQSQYMESELNLRKAEQEYAASLQKLAIAERHQERIQEISDEYNRAMFTLGATGAAYLSTEVGANVGYKGDDLRVHTLGERQGRDIFERNYMDRWEIVTENPEYRRKIYNINYKLNEALRGYRPDHAKIAALRTEKEALYAEMEKKGLFADGAEKIPANLRRASRLQMAGKLIRRSGGLASLAGIGYLSYSTTAMLTDNTNPAVEVIDVELTDEASR
jgi:hypothetical protein